jgi:hypothetical protein
MSWRTVEIAASALLFVCTVLLLVIQDIRFLVAFLIRMFFVAAVVVGTLWYALDEIGVL